MKKVMIISCFDWYDKRLKYIKRYYQSKNCKVEIVLSDFDHLSKYTIPPSKKIANCTYIKTIQYKKNISIMRIISHVDFSGKIKTYISNELPDIVYCLIPPNFLVKDIVKSKMSINFNLIFDVIDLWPENMPLDFISNTFIYKKWRNVRNKYINYADFVNLECNYYRYILSSSVDESKFHTFYVTKETKKGTENIANKDEYNQEYIDVCYLGSINSIIDIDKIVTILKKISSIKKVRIKIIGDGENKELFFKELKEANIVVEYFGPIYEWEKIEDIFRTCYFGINIYKDKLSVGITIKSIDYFQLGLPIINSIKGDTEEFINRDNVGINIKEFKLDQVEYFINNIVYEKERIRNFFNDTFSSETSRERLDWLSKTI